MDSRVATDSIQVSTLSTFCAVSVTTWLVLSAMFDGDYAKASQLYDSAVSLSEELIAQLEFVRDNIPEDSKIN